MKTSILALLLLVFAFSIHAQEAESTEEVPLYVPILMYHYIREVPENADAIQTLLTLDPEVFEVSLERHYLVFPKRSRTDKT